MTIIDEKMKEIYDGLSDELKEKAKACKTTDELMELAGKEGIELPDEVLDTVAGGCSCPNVTCHHMGTQKCPAFN